jgi:hypothetical protein
MNKRKLIDFLEKKETFVIFYFKANKFQSQLIWKGENT